MNVLAVGCHPDDIEIGCAGTLARYAQEGHRVFCCHVANGNMGHAVIEPGPLRGIRREEAKAAGALYGAEEVMTLDAGDLHVDSGDLGLRRAMVEVIRHAKPDVVLTHDPNDYMRDHVETSKLVFDASFCCTVPHYETESPTHPVFPPLYYMDTLAGVNFLPEEYVDITATVEVKLKALACHASQIQWMLEHDKIDFLDFVRVCSRYRGQQCNAGYAEGFRACNVWPRRVARRLLP
ncbi:MAG TPA: PIG-L family deacetylase [Clostridia bacterium]|nr:PIG-L family deacetylase [Clostridia bacterium]